MFCINKGSYLSAPEKQRYRNLGPYTGFLFHCSPEPDLIGIGAAVTRRPLPHHRAYGSVHGGSRGYAGGSSTSEGSPSDLKYAFESPTERALERARYHGP